MTQVLIPRATLEQLVAALNNAEDALNNSQALIAGRERFGFAKPCYGANEIALGFVSPAITAGRTALANAEPLTNVRTVTVSKFGVSFGNTTVSHERITGRNAEALNEGSGGVVSNEYMKWLNLPKDTL